jgi:hypothetical protein
MNCVDSRGKIATIEEAMHLSFEEKKWQRSGKEVASK